VDRSIDVRLGGEVDDGAGPMLSEQFADERGIADVAAHEDVPRVAVQRREASEVAGVSQLVEVDYRLTGRFHPGEREVRADEASAAGDNDHA
jgi:hypothetical protein